MSSNYRHHIHVITFTSSHHMYQSGKMEKNDKLVETRRIEKRLVETRGNGENGKFVEKRENMGEMVRL